MVTANAGWDARAGFGLLELNGKMWVLGGSTSTTTNDVWSSSDGITWTQVLANAPWSPRWVHVTGVYNNEIWVMGATCYYKLEKVGYNAFCGPITPRE